MASRQPFPVLAYHGPLLFAISWDWLARVYLYLMDSPAIVMRTFPKEYLGDLFHESM